MGLIHGVRRAIDAVTAAVTALGGVISFVLLAFLIVCGPGMIVGYQLGGRTGELVGALVLPVLFGALLAVRRVMGAGQGKHAPPPTDTDAAAVDMYARARGSGTDT